MILRSAIVVFFFQLFAGFLMPAAASQYAGGEIRYKYIDSSAAGITYRVQLILYRNTRSLAQFNAPVVWAMNSAYPAPVSYATSLNMNLVAMNRMPQTAVGFCALNSPEQFVDRMEFEATVTLPVCSRGYTLYFSDCCLEKPPVNIQNDGWNIGSEIVGGAPEPGLGVTYHTTIPPHTEQSVNSSPAAPDSIISACVGKQLFYDFKYKDPDGDELLYLWSPLNGQMKEPSILFRQAQFAAPFSNENPVDGITLNEGTGVLSGVPGRAGKYFLAIDIFEKRNGIIIGMHRKNFLLNVTACNLTLPPVITNCENLQVLFLQHPNQPNLTYAWDFGVQNLTTDTSSKPYPFYTYQQAGTYTITLTASSGEGCSETVKTTARMYPGLKPDFSWNAPVCDGTPVQLKNTTQFQWGTITRLEWRNITSRGVNLFSNDANPIFNYNARKDIVDQFSIELTVFTNLGCSASDLKVVYVYPKPLAAAGPDTTIGFNVPYQMPVKGSDLFTYQWSPAAGLNNASIANPVLVYDKDQKYVLKVSSANGGCVSYDTVTIKYAKGPELYIPSAFTPNADGLNDLLRFKAVNLRIREFIVFNRWGQQVFVWSPKNSSWDGNFKGIPQEHGIYSWTVKGIAPGEKPFVKQGTILLIR